jgi:t-SNARE complex subunit (syntaxin)
VPISRRLTTFVTLCALCAPVAGCGEDDVDKARDDIREQAKEIEGDIDNLSKDDLREALRDAKDTAKEGGADTKREARQLERKIKRELRERD